MDLILTHDNADFDALASQLAAHKLMPDALPVLSNRLNRNVRHFTTLYWDELPFLRPKDLPKEPVGKVVVVDTQTVQTLRGMTDQTEVQVIDHHDLRDGLNPGWKVSIEPTGAVTSVLCERLREERIPLTSIEATALLLGIYEDTGSLSYGSTTPRDVYAAAWLLERGALLDVVADFLHYALAEEQLDLLDELQDNAETIEIEGYPVVIAAASAPEQVEEIATLAHKLRDLLDPAAVFVLVDLGHHIQLVARSTVDAIDVGQVAEHFGGGGHGRAAAAILRDMSLDDARQSLRDLLPGYIHPTLTVSDLMSHGVQTLSPQAKVKDAARQMQRYGFEGFPVVDGGRVIGLLTRRAVDRALGHGLSGVRIDQLMDAGEVTVRPGESIATLQQTMMITGWGQIPVVDESGAITGVVTRTDLIKHLGHNDSVSRNSTITHALELALPEALLALLRAAGRLADEMGGSLYLVGGGVRDLLLLTSVDPLLDIPVIDIDFVVEGDAIALTRKLKGTFGGEMRSHARFGTGEWILTAQTWQEIARQLDAAEPVNEELPMRIDFVTARTEFYDEPTVLPEVERSSIKADLHRRDFTINTLAIRLDPRHFGQILDFYGGKADLRERRIRVLHSLSFVDDPTRILRAVRFEQRFRSPKTQRGFEIEPRTAELMTHAIPLLDRITGDRIKHEIEQSLAEREPERVFTRLSDLGVLARLHSDLTCDEWTKAAFRAVRKIIAPPLWDGLGDDFDLELPYFALLTYRLPVEAIHAVCDRLHVRRRTVETLDLVQVIRSRMGELSQPVPPSHVYNLLKPASDHVLAAGWAAAPTAQAREHITAFASRYRGVSPAADGATLIAHGLKPGPTFGTILDALRDAWLDGLVTTPEEERRLLARLLEDLH